MVRSSCNFLAIYSISKIEERDLKDFKVVFVHNPVYIKISLSDINYCLNNKGGVGVATQSAKQYNNNNLRKGSGWRACQSVGSWRMLEATRTFTWIVSEK